MKPQAAWHRETECIRAKALSSASFIDMKAVRFYSLDGFGFFNPKFARRDIRKISISEDHPGDYRQIDAIGQWQRLMV